MERSSPDYLKGFNHGYELQKHDPELLEEILKIPQDDNQYYDGLKEGKAEFDKEKEQTKNLDDWEKDRLGKLYKESSSRVKNQDIDLDK